MVASGGASTGGRSKIARIAKRRRRRMVASALFASVCTCAAKGALARVALLASYHHHPAASPRRVRAFFCPSASLPPPHRASHPPLLSRYAPRPYHPLPFACAQGVLPTRLAFRPRRRLIPSPTFLIFAVAGFRFLPVTSLKGMSCCVCRDRLLTHIYRYMTIPGTPASK